MTSFAPVPRPPEGAVVSVDGHPPVVAQAEPITFASPDVGHSEISAVLRVLRSGWLTTGGECSELERELSAYLGAPHTVAVSSCTAALEIVFAFLDLPPGARVAVPTWTFVASALAPARHGAVPVLLDVDPDDLNVSADSLQKSLRQGLDAVVVVHFGGVPAAAEVHALCADAGVPVVEDAAHALGADDHRGRLAGQGSVAACYSFYATKNLTSGEGGALVTGDPKLDAFARPYRLHGLSRDAWTRYAPGGRAGYDLSQPGIKANLPDLLAALARSQLSRFEGMQARRRALVLRYRHRLAELPGVRPVPHTLRHGAADHLMVVVLPPRVDREAVVARMAEEGVSTSVHFRPLHHFAWFRRHARIGPGGVSVADELAGRTLSLPLHPRLRYDQVDRVCDALGRALSA